MGKIGRLLLAATLTIFCFSINNAPRAQAPIGGWEVRHGDLGHIYRFNPNGTYRYERYGVIAGSRQTLDTESGTFVLQRDLLALTPRGGQQKVFRWKMGREATGASVLYLVYPNGSEEFLYPE